MPNEIVAEPPVKHTLTIREAANVALVNHLDHPSRRAAYTLDALAGDLRTMLALPITDDDGVDLQAHLTFRFAGRALEAR